MSAASMMDPAGASSGGAVTTSRLRLLRQAHTGRKVRGYLRFRLVREWPASR